MSGQRILRFQGIPIKLNPNIPMRGCRLVSGDYPTPFVDSILTGSSIVEALSASLLRSGFTVAEIEINEDSCKQLERELEPDLREAEPSLPTRYHAALNEVEAHARSTARSILELLREFEKATGAEVAEVKLARAYAYGVPPELKIVDLKLNPMPAARVRAGKEKG